MDGLLWPLIGVLLGICTAAACLSWPPLRRFTLAALIAIPVTSVVFLLGAFVIADMNPAREYGAAYIPNGMEHNPTWFHYLIWIISTLATLLSISWLIVRLQAWIIEEVKSYFKPISVSILEDHDKL
jgi:hypothetical protein